MKKLIISALAALALLFGVTSCSGDLHDDVLVDPNAMQGYWSYSIFTASAASSGSVGVIASLNGTPQSGAYGQDDIFSISAGNITYIIWDGKAGSSLTESTRTDEPSASDLGITLGSDEFAICIFTTSSSCSLWVYDSVDTDTNLSKLAGATDWPGVTTTATVQVAKVSKTLTGATLTITGLPSELHNIDLYFTGSGYSDKSWLTPSTDGTIKGTVSDSGELSITFPDYTKEFEEGTTVEFPIEGKFAADSNWDTQVTLAKGKNMSFTFTETVKAFSFVYADEIGTTDAHTYYAVKTAE